MTIEENEPLFTIGVVARKLGISVHTVRMYEREALVLAFRKKSGHRLFSYNDIKRIECIKRTISEKKISINGIKRLLSMIPCYRIKGCSEREREACPAYLEFENPCWYYKDKVKGDCATNECRECPVYNSVASCEELKALVTKLIVPKSVPK